jgi:hypothetical protein
MRIFGPRRGKLHEEELHNLYTSSSIIIMRKSGKMRLEGRVERRVEEYFV